MALESLTLVSGLMFSIIFLIMWMRVSLNKQQKGLFSRQLSNLSTGSSLRNLLEKIQQHRGMVNLYLKGDQSFKPKIIMLQEEINQQLNMLKKRGWKYSELLR